MREIKFRAWHKLTKIMAGVKGLYCSNRFQIVPAFSIADLDAKAWQAIGEKLGWDAASPFARAWVDEPIAMYRAWLTGGYAEADKFLNSILPK